MLHSSLLIQGVLTILGQFENWYEESFIHRIFSLIGKVVKKLVRGSKLTSFFRKFDLYLLVSSSFSLFRIIFRIFNTAITWIRIRIEEKVDTSRIFLFAESFTKLEGFLNIVGFMSLGFGLGLMVIYVLTKRVQGLLGLVFVVLGICNLLLCKNSSSKIKSSFLVKLLFPLYKFLLTDEEGFKWKK